MVGEVGAFYRAVAVDKFVVTVGAVAFASKATRQARIAGFLGSAAGIVSPGDGYGSSPIGTLRGELDRHGLCVVSNRQVTYLAEIDGVKVGILVSTVRWQSAAKLGRWWLSLSIVVKNC